jgi:hypothetical protein
VASDTRRRQMVNRMFTWYFDREGAALFTEDIIELVNPGGLDDGERYFITCENGCFVSKESEDSELYGGTLPLSEHEPIVNRRLTQFKKVGNRLVNPELLEE